MNRRFLEVPTLYTRAVIYPYKLGSHSALELAEALNTICVRPNGKFRPSPRTLVVNWGSRNLPNWWGPLAASTTLNRPQYVENASAKDKTLRVLRDNGLQEVIVPFTHNRADAERWLRSPVFGPKFNAVVCRTLTRANSGNGVVVATKPEDLVQAPLYTRYVPKEREFRVHVFNDTVIDVQEKKKAKDFTGTFDKYIRNHPRGWVFCRIGVNVPDPVRDAAQHAVSALGLQFGAVDIGWDGKIGPRIYEVNTAPGLEGQTIKAYADAIRNHISHS
jgi:hypothetical protein